MRNEKDAHDEDGLQNRGSTSICVILIRTNASRVIERCENSKKTQGTEEEPVIVPGEANT
jgi:hypothetical protein